VKQKTEQPQRGNGMLRVVRNFANSFTVIQN